MKVEGYFDNIKTANEAAEKLKGQGYSGAFVDINEHRNGAYKESGSVGTEDVSSLSVSVLGDSSNRGEGVNSPLAAASPMVSGMGGFEEIADINCKVVVDVRESDVESAKKAIKDMGGMTDSPNTKIPRGLENISEDALILKNLKD